MHRGKFSTHNKTKRSKRSYILLASLVLIVGLGIGTTAAYLATNSTTVTNTFAPAKVEVKVDETFENNVKEDIGATNNSDVKAYVRITLAEYWMKGNDIVPKPEGGSVDDVKVNPGWIEKDGIYYYTLPLEPGKSAVAINKVEAEVPTGYTYHLDVYAEAIQAEPKEAVVNAWGVVLGDNGAITAVGSVSNSGVG